MLLPFCDNRQLYKWDKSKCTEPLTKSLTCFERSQKIVHALMVATKKINAILFLHLVLNTSVRQFFWCVPKLWLGLIWEKRCPSWSHRDSMALDRVVSKIESMPAALGGTWCRSLALFFRTHSLSWTEGTLSLNPRKNATKISRFLWIT